MKLKLKKSVRRTLIIALIILGLIISGIGVYQYQLSPVGKKDTEVITVEIPSGSGNKKIGQILKDKGLIRSTGAFLVYIKLNGITNLKASTYDLSLNMSLKEIVAILAKGNTYNPNVVRLTFKEGLNIRQVALEIASKTNHSYDEIISKMQDETFIDTLINKYWFLTDEIKDSDIYYPLEGYLFPDTYEFKNKDVSVGDIITRMLDEMDSVLTEDKKEIDKSSFTIHQLLTLASMVELEGVNDEDRDMIAGVFYNRLNAGWSLGSDVTACYGAKVDIKDCNDSIDYNAYTPYNTRNIQMAGKLPIGPICNPSKNSIIGSISPSKHSYYYFVADKYKRVYFTKTEKEHLAKVQEIKNKGEWPW